MGRSGFPDVLPTASRSQEDGGGHQVRFGGQEILERTLPGTGVLVLVLVGVGGQVELGHTYGLVPEKCKDHIVESVSNKMVPRVPDSAVGGPSVCPHQGETARLDGPAGIPPPCMSVSSLGRGVPRQGPAVVSLVTACMSVLRLP